MGSFITGALAAGLSLETVLLRTSRSIADIFPDVVIEERHTDELEITTKPVEQGANIAFNCFKRPASLSMRVGWSNSANGIIGLISGSSDILDVYQSLLDLQATRTPFDVVTGKRSYKNMLMKLLFLNTTKETENSLSIDVSFEQVIIVNTQTTTLPPIATQTLPEKTGEAINNGTKQVKQASQSILSTVFGGN